MKKTNKIFSVILALVLVFAMAIPVFATNITIEKGHENSAYSAWRLLDATNAGENYAYTVNETYRAVLQTVTGKTTDTEIVEYIDGLDATAIRAFADAVYAEVKSMAADATATNSVFSDVAQGYYLIAETAVGSAADTYSLVMLDTAGQEDITVETKEDVPTVEKKVKDVDGTAEAWQDSADLAIGDIVYFQITGTVSDRFESFTTYEYAFHDEMSAGLTYNEGSVKVMAGETDITSAFTVTAAGNKLDVECADLKAVAAVTADSQIVLTYNATLNESAVTGTAGNPNTVYIEYDNNPYDEDKGDEETTGTSEEDKVTIFTYKLVVDKVDDKDAALEGAGFTLYKDGEAIGDEITGVTTFTWNGLDAGTYKLVETTVPAGYNKADDVEFTITATHDAESADPQLTELTVTPADDFTVTLATGTVATKIENKAGSLLPETGGIGTTIFYVVGSILVVGAAILLITKKRMSCEA